MSNLTDFQNKLSLTIGGNTAGVPALISNGTVGLHGGPNITLSQIGKNVTISGNPGGGGGGIAASAGTQLATSGTVVFSNSNNVTFGMTNSSIVTASASFPAETPFGVSAGTQSVSTGTLVFSNSNNVTFGMSGSSRVTASFSQSVQAGTITVTGTTALNSTGTYAGGLIVSGNSRITLGMSNGSLVIQGANPLNVSAGTTSQNLNTVVFSDSNNVSFGLNVQTITASASFAGLSAGMTTAGNTLGDTGLVTGRLVLVGNPNITLSGSTNGGSMTITISGGAGAAGNTGSISAGTTRGTLGEVVFSNSNNVSFGINGQTVTATVTVPAETPFGVSAGTQSVSTGTLVFSNSNNVTFGMSGSSRVTASASFPAETPFGISAGTQSVSTGTMIFSDSNGISFGMSGSSRITASYTVPAQISAGMTTAGNTLGDTGLVTGRLVLVGNPNITLSGSTNGGSMTITISGGAGAAGNTGSISAGTTRGTLGEVVFSNSNNVSFGINGQTVTATVTVPAETPFGVSAGTQSVSTGTLVFSNSNNVTFGMSGSSRVTASASFPAETPFGISAGTQSVSTGTMVFSDSNGISFGMSGSSRITASFSESVQAGSITVTGNTAANSTGTYANALIVNASTNITAWMSNGSLVLSGGAGGGGGGNVSFSAGTSSAALGSVVFNDSNLVSFGLNGSTITGSVPATSSLSATGALSISVNGSTISIGLGDLSRWEPFVLYANTSFGTFGNNSIFVQPLLPPINVHVGQFSFIASFNNASSSISHAVSDTWSYCLYSKGSGTNLTRLESIGSSSMVYIASYSSNLSGGYTISQGTVSTTLSSAGLNNSSLFTGQKYMLLPFVTTLTGGGQYYLAFARSSTSAGNLSALRMSQLLLTGMTNASLGFAGPKNAAAFAVQNTNDPAMFLYSSTSNAFPANIVSNSMSVISNLHMYLLAGTGT